MPPAFRHRAWEERESAAPLLRRTSNLPANGHVSRRTFGTAPLAVRLATSGTSDSDGVTGGVYKTREHIHRAMLMRDY